MLYDLNIAWSPGTPSAELERTLKFAKNLGYDVVALNHIITGSIPTQPTPITNPIPQLTPPHPSFPGGYPSSSSTIPTSRSTTTTTTTTTTTNLSTTAATTATRASSLPTTLRRATVVIADPATTNYRLPEHARAYDVLAVRPTTEKAFSWACLSTTDPPALISLDLASHLGWHVHHRTAMAAVQRGCRFEVCYAQALSGGGGGGLHSSSSGGSSSSNGGSIGPDAARQRANFIGNVQALVRATKGRGIVVSSEARGALGLRAPADVVNLLAVWGLGPERGFAALGEAARAVVVNEGIRRRGFRGVVDIVRPAERGVTGEEQKKKGGAEGEGERGNGTAGKKGKGGGAGGGGAGPGAGGQKQQQQQQGQKRKNGEGGKKQAKKVRGDVPLMKA